MPRPVVRGFLFIDFLWICDIFKVIKGTHRGGLSPFSSLKNLTQSFRPVGKLYFLSLLFVVRGFLFIDFLRIYGIFKTIEGIHSTVARLF